MGCSTSKPSEPQATNLPPAPTIKKAEDSKPKVNQPPQEEPKKQTVPTPQEPVHSADLVQPKEEPKPAIVVSKDDGEDAFGLLLCGAGESGKTTFTRQLKLKFLDGFKEEERVDFLRTIKIGRAHV